MTHQEELQQIRNRATASVQLLNSWKENAERLQGFIDSDRDSTEKWMEEAWRIELGFIEDNIVKLEKQLSDIEWGL